jgi:hypothetical protein
VFGHGGDLGLPVAPGVVIQDLGAIGVQAAARERVLETKFPG